MSMSAGDLFEACKKGDIAAIRRAVANGVDVRKVVDKSWPYLKPLHYACRYEVIIKIMYSFCAYIMVHEV